MNHYRYFRIDGNVDGLALPLRLGVNGIKHKMKEEGLFRFLHSWITVCTMYIPLHGSLVQTAGFEPVWGVIII